MTTKPDRDVSTHLREIETKLDRLLATGWRSSTAEAAGLTVEADVVAAAGLLELAARLNAVATATSPAGALSAITLASAACRMLRAHLSAVAPQHDDQPTIKPVRRRMPDAEMLLPLCRMSMGGREWWSCLRSRGFAVEWVLVNANTAPTPPGSPWLRRPLYGHLRWQGRFPLGATRDVQVHVVARADWESDQPTTLDPHAAFRKRLASGKLRQDRLPVWGGGSVHLTPLSHDKLDGLLWFDPAVATGIARIEHDAWALVWDQESTPAVIAVMTEEGTIRKRLHIVHLVPGCPSDPVD